MINIIQKSLTIKFRPSDNKVGLPMELLDFFEKSSDEEVLTNEEKNDLYEKSLIQHEDGKYYDSNVYRQSKKEIIIKRNKYETLYNFRYSNGYFEFNKIDDDWDIKEVEYMQEFVRNNCSKYGIDIEIQVDEYKSDILGFDVV